MISPHDAETAQSFRTEGNEGNKEKGTEIADGGSFLRCDPGSGVTGVSWALTDSGIGEGIFVTVRGYTEEAKEFAGKHRIAIVDRSELLWLLRQSEAAEDPEAAEILSDTRKYCPKCESEMVLRTATRGPGAGERFWGCSAG